MKLVELKLYQLYRKRKNKTKNISYINFFNKIKILYCISLGYMAVVVIIIYITHFALRPIYRLLYHIRINRLYYICVLYVYANLFVEVFPFHKFIIIICGCMYIHLSIYVPIYIYWNTKSLHFQLKIKFY